MSITTCIWFQGDIEAALERYRSLFPDFEVLRTQAMGEDQPPLSVHWRMHGTDFQGINQVYDKFGATEAMSLVVSCADQEEVDHYWDGLLADGGQESQCGWLRDPFGVWWQIVPVRLMELLADPDPARARAATDAMLAQRRIVIAELEAAAAAASATGS